MLSRLKGRKQLLLTPEKVSSVEDHVMATDLRDEDQEDDPPEITSLLQLTIPANGCS